MVCGIALSTHETLPVCAMEQDWVYTEEGLNQLRHSECTYERCDKSTFHWKSVSRSPNSGPSQSASSMPDVSCCGFILDHRRTSPVHWHPSFQHQGRTVRHSCPVRQWDQSGVSVSDCTTAHQCHSTDTEMVKTQSLYPTLRVFTL